MRHFLTLLVLSCFIFTVSAQLTTGRELKLVIVSDEFKALPKATVKLLRADSTLVQTQLSNDDGQVLFKELLQGNYFCQVLFTGFIPVRGLGVDLIANTTIVDTVKMVRDIAILGDVSVTSKKPYVQFYPDKTVINVEASITNTGSTVLEVLEKSPGVTVDRNGSISLKGRPAVQIMIDGKITQLAGVDLQNLLSGMNAAQVDVIELIENPGARYDAAGNAGIINIKTKKNKQRGFNGSFTVAYGQGRLPKNNNNVILNYREGRFNFFSTYSVNISRHLLEMYALRTYYDQNNEVASLLEQPYYTKTKAFTQNIRVGVDYFLSDKTTIGTLYTGTYLTRDNRGESTALWMNAAGDTDSSILTYSHNTSKLRQNGINFNARHVFDMKSELTADIDIIGYEINSSQDFENQLAGAGNISDASKGYIPSKIDIFSAKADYSRRFGNITWEAGWKSSRVKTDNLAMYYYYQANDWIADLGKSNHFLYNESIHALYSSLDAKWKKWDIQGGLRYEYTGYDARQLGNAIVKDSAFNRNYNSLFPSAFVTYRADSNHSFTFRTGRRIDRPAFQKLNPFVFIINKYTFQQGNPYFKPQYTWNLELNHVYKERFTTSVSYNLTRDYISQVFFSDTSTGIIVYTEGNVGKLQNIGVSVSAQLAPTKWWSFTAQAVYNHKIIEGVLWRVYKASINQMNLSINNQFRFNKGWSAELSGFYITRNQNDLQEVLDPTGQVSAGLSKQILKSKGTLRLTARDIFYTQVMAGLTHFESVIEYFSLKRDTRVVTISFTYRFGKVIKQPKRSGGGATDEINRVGTVN